MIESIVDTAAKVRKEGILALEDELNDLEDPFLAKAMALVVDGNRPQAVREMLQIEDHATEELDETSAEVYEAAGGYAPTIGILGAVLGLIHVMGSLSDPNELGAGIAVAFVATLYGVGSANLLFLPIASKIRVKAKRASQHRRIVMTGVAAIQDGLSPPVIEMTLCSLSGIPVAKRPARRRAA